MKKNYIHHGDNLEFMNSLPEACIDLIYIDPPFCTQRNHEIYNADNLLVNSFSDKWDNGIVGYLDFLNPRLKEMHRLLKKTGSLYVHLDQKAVHYVKVELDKIFGKTNFKNHIVWKRKHGSMTTGSSRNLPCNADHILFYSKTKKHNIFNEFFIDDSGNLPTSIVKAYNKNDNDGRGLYKFEHLHAPSYNKRGLFEFRGIKSPKKGWRWNKVRLEKAFKDGILHFPKDKNRPLRYKSYLDNRKGAAIENIWIDISSVKGVSKESRNYPTQKPITLLERIIKLSTNEGDLVADFFAGSGTTLDSAQSLGRHWIGSDQSKDAVEIIKNRMEK